MPSTQAAGADAPVISAEQFRQQLADDYGQYEAAYRITSRSGALIYDTGHPVPASNVDDEGRISLSRHHCRREDDSCAGNEANRCEHFDEVDARTEPGAAVPVEQPAPAQKAQDVQDLMEVMHGITAAVAKRPTGRPSDSSAGRPTTKPNSAAKSSSRVKHRLEQQGRPDLALMVLEADEARAAKRSA